LSRKGQAVRVFPWTNHRQGRRRFVTKQEFVDRVASKANLSRRDAAAAVDAFLDSITDALRGGDDVAFTGFGKFTTQHRKARQGVNPRNPSQKVQIPASTVPKFSAGSQLKQAVKTSGGGGGGGDGEGGAGF
jgi:DNA-binding protein HU-beta